MLLAILQASLGENSEVGFCTPSYKSKANGELWFRSSDQYRTELSPKSRTKTWFRPSDRQWGSYQYPGALLIGSALRTR